MGMSPVNPAAAQAARNVVAQLAQRGSPRASIGGGAGPFADNPGSGEMVQQELSQLRGADPEALLRKLKEMKQEIAALVPQTVVAIPGAARHLAGLFKGFDGAIKEVQQASQTANAVGPPVELSPANVGGGTGATGPAAGGVMGATSPANAVGGG